ncbi:hypothetical protein J6590_013409 [Homalodisca vitripennis]|nr:hypothetical protein J6590_103976 [Homalodisca vitripennis]KAG8307716.1 hypothetical protein J6590_013409 [Homalodisca vitripennis]
MAATVRDGWEAAGVGIAEGWRGKSAAQLARSVPIYQPAAPRRADIRQIAVTRANSAAANRAAKSPSVSSSVGPFTRTDLSSALLARFM